MKSYQIAKSIVQKLVDHGFIAYFAGGWVRDFLLKHPSDDIDIATNATPEDIAKIFPKTILVGARFGVVIVVQGGHQFEVTSFRQDLGYYDGRTPHGVIFTTAEEDALRRDFTINGMFYDPLRDELYDYVEGRQDLERGIIRTIGNPKERFTEDRLRLIRAIRFAHRFNFTIEAETEKAILEHANTLFPSVSMERIWQELNKMRASPRFDKALIELKRLGLLSVIFPSIGHLPLEKIIELVRHLPHFPKECPTLLCLMTLFHDASLEEWVEVGKYLKVPNADLKLLEIVHPAKDFVMEEPHALSHYDWALFYSNAHAEMILNIVAATLPEERRAKFLEDHLKLKRFLNKDILRLQNKKPIITSSLLRQEGIAPGPLMGKLLLLAEQISTNERITDIPTLLQKLKESPLWPKISS